jgi:hypothetical protein
MAVPQREIDHDILLNHPLTRQQVEVSGTPQKWTDISESTRHVPAGGIGTNLDTRTAFSKNAMIEVYPGAFSDPVYGFQTK